MVHRVARRRSGRFARRGRPRAKGAAAASRALPPARQRVREHLSVLGVEGPVVFVESLAHELVPFPRKWKRTAFEELVMDEGSLADERIDPSPEEILIDLPVVLLVVLEDEPPHVAQEPVPHPPHA